MEDIKDYSLFVNGNLKPWPTDRIDEIVTVDINWGIDSMCYEADIIEFCLKDILEGKKVEGVTVDFAAKKVRCVVPIKEKTRIIKIVEDWSTAQKVFEDNLYYICEGSGRKKVNNCQIILKGKDIRKKVFLGLRNTKNNMQLTIGEEQNTVTIKPHMWAVFNQLDKIETPERIYRKHRTIIEQLDVLLEHCKTATLFTSLLSMLIGCTVMFAVLKIHSKYLLNEVSEESLSAPQTLVKKHKGNDKGKEIENKPDEYGIYRGKISGIKPANKVQKSIFKEFTQYINSVEIGDYKNAKAYLYPGLINWVLEDDDSFSKEDYDDVMKTSVNDIMNATKLLPGLFEGYKSSKTFIVDIKEIVTENIKKIYRLEYATSIHCSLDRKQADYYMKDTCYAISSNNCKRWYFLEKSEDTSDILKREFGHIDLTENF